MALIKCPECSTEVSDQADACPKCAYPIAKPAANKVQTVEQTGKKFKLQTLLSILMIIGGGAMLVSQVVQSKPSELAITWGIVICIIGIFWRVTVKFFAWWSHG